MQFLERRFGAKFRDFKTYTFKVFLFFFYFNKGFVIFIMNMRN